MGETKEISTYLRSFQDLFSVGDSTGCTGGRLQPILEFLVARHCSSLSACHALCDESLHDGNSPFGLASRINYAHILPQGGG